MKYTKNDKTINDTYITREKNLNGITYQEYLKSEHWKKVKLKASRRKNYKKCEFCNSLKVDLHHKNYKWILTPFELRSIIALCREHHEEVHEYSKKNKCSVSIATNALRRIYKPDFFKKNTPN